MEGYGRSWGAYSAHISKARWGTHWWGWGRVGAPCPHLGPYLLRHSSLHHAGCIGLQAVIVSATRAQLQKGPPGGGRRGQSVSGRGPQLDTRHLQAYTTKTIQWSVDSHLNVRLSIFVSLQD